LSKPSVRPPVFTELQRRPAAPPEPARSAEGLEAVREGHRIAHAIIARAEAQAHEISAAAREQGFEAGRREALERAQVELRHLGAALAAAAARLEQARQELAETLAAELPALAVGIAERLLLHELSVRPETVVRVIRDAVHAVLPTTRLEIRLHPDDLAILERHRALLADALAGVDVRFEPSPTVGRGGCLLETPALTLAGGLPERVARALELLRGGEA